MIIKNEVIVNEVIKRAKLISNKKMQDELYNDTLVLEKYKVITNKEFMYLNRYIFEKDFDC